MFKLYKHLITSISGKKLKCKYLLYEDKNIIFVKTDSGKYYLINKESILTNSVLSLSEYDE